MSRRVRGGRSGRQVVRFSGRFVSTLTTASAVLITELSPLNLDSRGQQASDVFNMFRFTRIVASLHPIEDGSSASNRVTFTAITYAHVVPVNDPTTLVLALVSSDQAAYGTGEYGSPLPRLRLGRRHLNGQDMLKWYRHSTAAEDMLETQGQLVFSCSPGTFSTMNQVLVVEYDVEFTDRIDPTLTPATQRGVIAPLPRIPHSPPVHIPSVVPAVASPARPVDHTDAGVPCDEEQKEPAAGYVLA